MQTELSERIWARTVFQAEYLALLQSDVAQDWGHFGVSAPPITADALGRLLASAVHFCSSKHSEHRDAALRIATIAATRGAADLNGIRDLVSLILVRLGNFPMAEYLCKTFESDVPIQWPTPLWFEANSHRIRNTKRVSSESDVVLTDFQRRMWDALDDARIVSVSAPTSAGKSFALQQYIVSQLAVRQSWCLYLAPTRALLQQVSTDLTARLRAAGVQDVAVTTIPVGPDELRAACGVYVLTPERLQLLLRSSPGLRFSIAIIDEAQTIANDDRGILLQAVSLSLFRQDTPKMLFAAPNADNPEVFAAAIGADKVLPIPERDSPVAQTLVFLNVSEGDERIVRMEANLNGNRVAIGQMVMPFSLLKPKRKLAALAWQFGREDINIVYAGGKAECEDVGQLIVDMAREDSERQEIAESVRSKREEFARFVEEHIHPQYILAQALREGVAFHYGNMPSLIRSTIEEYFSQGVLRFVVCTSTLLYGVNLPARNIFMMDPTKGTNQPISDSDFWNLAGRAGRLGKDVAGRVYLIDSDTWFKDESLTRREQSVSPALRRAVVDNLSELLAFISYRDHPSGDQKVHESAFTQLCLAHYENGLGSLLRDVVGAGPDVVGQLEASIGRAVDTLAIPAPVVQDNPSISPYRQDELYSVVLERARRLGPRSILPPHPNQKGAYDKLAGIFKLLRLHLEKRSDESHRYFAVIALQWMQGSPIRMLIDEAYRRKAARRKAKGGPKVGTVVRDVFDTIESDLRFRYVKHTRCYNDVAIAVLNQVGAAELAQHVPAIPLYLELGACSLTMMSMIGLGLSRTAAYMVSEKAANTEMDQLAARAWLSRQDFGVLGLSPIARAEIGRVLGSSPATGPF